MKGLYLHLDHRGQDVQRLKDRQPGRIGVTGSKVCFTEFASAVLRYSTYDLLILPPAENDDLEALTDSPLFRANADRIRFLENGGFGDLRGIDTFVLSSVRMNLAELARLRRINGCPCAPVVGLIHSLNYATTIQDMTQMFMLGLSASDALVCTSSAGQRAVFNYLSMIAEHWNWKRGDSAPIRLPIIPLGVDAAAFEGGDGAELRSRLGLGSDPVILYFGRFSFISKGDLLPLLIAFSDLLRSGSRAALLLAGDDTQFGMARELEAFAGKLGCAERVRVVADPTVTEKFGLYACADIFVSPADSLQETFGITILEAMAAGLPVVASDWDGYVDLVVHGATGYLIPTYFPDYSRRFDDLRGMGHMKTPDPLAATTVLDVAALRESLARLLADPDHRRALGAAGQRLAREKFDWCRVIGRHEELWGQLACDAQLNARGEAAGQDLTRWSFQRIFGHYATGVLGRETRLQLTSRGRRWLEDPTGAESGAAGPWFAAAELLEILARVESRGEASIGELAERLPPESDGAIRHLGNVHRLLKYDLVQIAEGHVFSARGLPAGVREFALHAALTVAVPCGAGFESGVR